MPFTFSPASLSPFPLELSEANVKVVPHGQPAGFLLLEFSVWDTLRAWGHSFISIPLHPHELSVEILVSSSERSSHSEID